MIGFKPGDRVHHSIGPGDEGGPVDVVGHGNSPNCYRVRDIRGGPTFAAYEHHLGRIIPTLAENQARLGERQRAVIAEAGYSMPADGRANTSGIRRDFEPGGLTGDSIW